MSRARPTSVRKPSSSRVGEVARAQPLAAQRRGGLVGAVPVAEHRDRSAHDDLAGLADRGVAPAFERAVDRRLRHDAQLGVEHRPPDAARLADRVARVEAAQDRRLGLAEALLQHDAARLEAADLLDRHRGARAEQEAQARRRRRAARAPRARRAARRAGWARAPRKRDALGRDALPGARGVEARLEEDAPRRRRAWAARGSRARTSGRAAARRARGRRGASPKKSSALRLL